MKTDDRASELVIEAGHPEAHYWADIWRYRELLWFFAWRELAVRYKQTVIGIAWCVIKPLTAIIIFTVIFGNLARLPSDGVPYPLLVLVAMLPWQFFAAALSETANSLLANSSLISKIYFPRLIVPASMVVVNLADLLISFSLLALFLLWYEHIPSWRVVTLPIFLIIASGISLGMGLWLAALNVKYRDFRYIVPYAVQFGLYVSPVGFASSIVPDSWRLLYSLNPMVGVIDGFRWAILGTDVTIYWPGFALSVTLTLTILISGVLFFRRMERTFADVI